MNNNGKTHSIKAGGDISAGGDITIGNKKVINNSVQVKQNKDLVSFENLVEKAKWRMENINHKEIYICETDNTYQIEIGDKDENQRDFTEEWTQVYPDKFGSELIPVYLKINNTIIKQLSFIYCDGYRIFVPLPKRKIDSKGIIVYFWKKQSLEYKIAKIIGEYYCYKNIKGVAKKSGIKII